MFPHSHWLCWFCMCLPNSITHLLLLSTVSKVKQYVFKSNSVLCYFGNLSACLYSGPWFCDMNFPLATLVIFRILMMGRGWAYGSKTDVWIAKIPHVAGFHLTPMKLRWDVKWKLVTLRVTFAISQISSILFTSPWSC